MYFLGPWERILIHKNTVQLVRAIPGFQDMKVVEGQRTLSRLTVLLSRLTTVKRCTASKKRC
jgi:hypothetical protein